MLLYLLIPMFIFKQTLLINNLYFYDKNGLNHAWQKLADPEAQSVVSIFFAVLHEYWQ